MQTPSPSQTGDDQEEKPPGADRDNPGMSDAGRKRLERWQREDEEEVRRENEFIDQFFRRCFGRTPSWLKKQKKRKCR